MTRHGLALSAALLLSTAGFAGAAPPSPDAAPLRFAVSFPRERSATPLDGRVLLIISTDGSEARRHEVADLDVRLYVEKPFRPEVMRDVLSTLSTADTHA